jgi:predicted nucleotidyltransferase
MQVQWKTLNSEKASKVARMVTGVVALKKELGDYAQRHGSSFLIYGSIAKGTYRHDSDIDILVDFPDDSVSDAWRFCEDACQKHKLKPDVRPKNLCSAKFLKGVMIGAVELGNER